MVTTACCNSGVDWEKLTVVFGLKWFLADSERSRAGRRIILQFCAIRMGATSKREMDGLVKTDNKSKDLS